MKMTIKTKTLLYEPYMTHQEIADVFGTSRAAIQMTEKKALNKLRLILMRRGITAKDFFGGMEQFRGAWFATKRSAKSDE